MIGIILSEDQEFPVNYIQLECEMETFSGDPIDMQGQPLTCKTCATKEKQLLGVQCGATQCTQPGDHRLWEEGVNTLLLLLHVVTNHHIV